MNTSNCKEELKKKEYAARRKELKKEEVGSGNSNTDSFNSGSGPDYQLYMPLGWLFGEGSV
jgi:hypothetical protein